MAVLSVSGGTLTGSTVTLGDGSAVLDGSCTLVISPVSMAAGTVSVSACELQSDGSSVPLTVESGGSATVTGVIFRSSAGDITAVSVSEGGSLTVGESQLVGADGSSDRFPCEGTLPDCVGVHAGSVDVDGPAAITLASPLVCDMVTGACDAVTCPDIAPLGYSYDNSARALGTVATLSTSPCSDGNGDGSDRLRTCQVDGTWSGDGPDAHGCRQCVLHMCADYGCSSLTCCSALRCAGMADRQ